MPKKYQYANQQTTLPGCLIFPLVILAIFLSICTMFGLVPT